MAIIEAVVKNPPSNCNQFVYIQRLKGVDEDREVLTLATYQRKDTKGKPAKGLSRFVASWESVISGEESLGCGIEFYADLRRRYAIPEQSLQYLYDNSRWDKDMEPVEFILKQAANDLGREVVFTRTSLSLRENLERVRSESLLKRGFYEAQVITPYAEVQVEPGFQGSQRFTVSSPYNIVSELLDFRANTEPKVAVIINGYKRINRNNILSLAERTVLSQMIQGKIRKLPHLKNLPLTLIP